MTNLQAILHAFSAAKVEFLIVGVGSAQWIQIPEDCTINELRVTGLDTGIATAVPDPEHRWQFHLTGVHQGTTTLRVGLWHENHSHFTSEAIPVTVTCP